MPYLLAYQLTTGLIQGVWTAVAVEHLQPNVQEDHPTLGYLLVEDDPLTPAQIQERYYVQDGVLKAAAELTLLAVPNPFVADGVAECVVRPEPFVPCTLLVGPLASQTSVALTVSTDPLILTADTPQAFPIRLAPLAGYWAADILVEAT
jgi:hypothetical protein